MNYRVSKAKDGRILVMEDSGFAASYEDGKWVNRILFSADEMNEEFRYVRNEAEAKKLWEAARAELKKTLSA
jgi:hypothetical protein